MSTSGYLALLATDKEPNDCPALPITAVLGRVIQVYHEARSQGVDLTLVNRLAEEIAQLAQLARHESGR